MIQIAYPQRRLIHRYDEYKTPITKLNPLEDYRNWVSGLRSKGYTADLLREIHGFNDAKEIALSAKAISAHAEHAVNLLQQAMSGPSDVSYLPIYYCMLNLAKICVIISGYREELRKQKWHGVKYIPKKRPQDLSNETIVIKSEGAIPLYYKSITGQPLPDREIKRELRQIYPFIRYISHEYMSIYHCDYCFARIAVEMLGNVNDGFYLSAEINPLKQTEISNRQLKVLCGFHSKDLNPGLPIYYHTDTVGGTEEEAKPVLLRKIRRFLLVSDVDAAQNPVCFTPISGSPVFALEEFNIILAFFHLSNVVRYNPEYLNKLKDSKAWSLLLALRQHGSLGFLEHFWSFVNKKLIMPVSL